jgi:hypothetical protein
MAEDLPIPYGNPSGSLPKNRRLRRGPVQRDEVSIALSRNLDHWFLTTMPVGTYRRVKKVRRFEGRTSTHEFVGEPALWQSLIDELKAKSEADFEREEVTMRALFFPAEYYGPPRPVFLEPEAREYVCEHCGKSYLGRNWPEKRLRLCSSRCEREHAAAVQRRWREANAVTSTRSHASRAKKRAKARADRTCEHCGVAIEAARSTKRFCSDLCRIRAHHQRSSPPA